MRLLLPLGLLLLPLLLGTAAAQPPTAVDDRFVYGSSQAVNGWFTVDVLANDSADQARAVEVVSPPTDGVVEPTTRPVGFRWKRGSAVSAQWTYRIIDAAGNYSNTATVFVGVRVGPHPHDDAYEATDGVLLRVSAPGVLGNDRHPEGEHLTAEGNSRNGFTARGGRYVIARDGSFEYAPPIGFTGQDSFSYLAVDPQNDAADATVTITVHARPTTTRPTTTEHVPGAEGDRPSTDKPEVTVHLYGYPGTCAKAVIIVGGRTLDTWLDESQPGSPNWEFIDLHAIIPDGLTAGVRRSSSAAAAKPTRRVRYGCPPPRA